MQVGLALLTVIALAALIGAIPTGLLDSPDMHIVSPVSPGGLTWFADRTAGPTPAAGALSVSLWFYKAAMLAWALWLSFALLRWLPWAWRAWSQGVCGVRRSGGSTGDSVGGVMRRRRVAAGQPLLPVAGRHALSIFREKAIQ